MGWRCFGYKDLFHSYLWNVNIEGYWFAAKCRQGLWSAIAGARMFTLMILWKKKVELILNQGIYMPYNFENYSHIYMKSIGFRRICFWFSAPLSSVVWHGQLCKFSFCHPAPDNYTKPKPEFYTKCAPKYKTKSTPEYYTKCAPEYYSKCAPE